MKNCPNCKSKKIRLRDFEFMIREICGVCGWTHDTPKVGKEAEYDEWWKAHNEAFFKAMEGE